MAKQGADKVQAAALGHNSSTLNKGVDSIIKIDEKIGILKQDRVTIFNRLADTGYDTKEVAAAIKIKKKPAKASFKLGVNQLCLQLGLPEEYSLTAEQKKQAESDNGHTGEEGQEEEFDETEAA